MTTPIENATRNLKEAVDLLNGAVDEHGVDITASEFLKIAEVSALVAIAEALTTQTVHIDAREIAKGIRWERSASFKP